MKMLSTSKIIKKHSVTKLTPARRFSVQQTEVVAERRTISEASSNVFTHHVIKMYQSF